MPADPAAPFVHLPYSRQAEETDFLLGHCLQAEIGLTGDDLDSATPAQLEELGDRFHCRGLSLTVHAPFNDLNPGALEPLVADVTERRLRQTFEAANRLGAELVVVHPGYDPWRYGFAPVLWLERCLRFWPPLLEEAERLGCRIALENVFDQAVDPLAELLERLDVPHLGHCLDIGHWQLFVGGEIGAWLDRLGERLFHVHLHDNRGKRDDHLPLGDGVIDFGGLFRQLKERRLLPSMTLETRSRSAALKSISALQEMRCPS